MENLVLVSDNRYVHRTPSAIAQATFELVHRLRVLTKTPSRAVNILARIAGKFVSPVAKKVGANHTIVAQIYGRSMTLPAEHALPDILELFPQYNRPLALAVEALSRSTGQSALTVIDVGANVGDTAAVIEQRLPNFCSYLCIEPDSDLAAICSANHAHNPRIQIKQNFIGEDEGSSVQLQDDGRANPSTLPTESVQPQQGTTTGHLVRLDTLARDFASSHGHVSLIKIDTEGYDFSVLRSGPELLENYHPSIFLEWYPELLLGLKEQVWEGFEHLATFGYCYFVFFTNRGDFYCRISNPDRLFLRSLASIVLHDKVHGYFDVFASTSSAVCDELVELSISELESRSGRGNAS